MSEKVDITLSAEDLLQYLEHVNEEIDATEKKADIVIKETRERSQAAFTQVLNAARGTYLLTLGAVKASGETMSYFFRAAISSTFATITMLEPLLLGRAMATSDWVSFAIGMASLATSWTAAIAAQLGAEEFGRSMRGIDMSMLGIQQLIGVMGFL